jgi:hypothetical protein
MTGQAGPSDDLQGVKLQAQDGIVSLRKNREFLQQFAHLCQYVTR